MFCNSTKVVRPIGENFRNGLRLLTSMATIAFALVSLFVVGAAAVSAEEYDLQYYGPSAKSYQGGMAFSSGANLQRFEAAAIEYIRWKRPGLDLSPYGKVLILPVKESRAEMQLWYWSNASKDGWLVRLSPEAKVTAAEQIYEAEPDIAQIAAKGQTKVLLSLRSGGKKTVSALLDAVKKKGGIPPAAGSVKPNVKVFYSAQMKAGIQVYFSYGKACKSWVVDLSDSGEPLAGREVTDANC